MLLSTYCLFIGMLTISCASKNEHSLVGSWQEINGAESIEFHKDGSFQGKMIWDMNKQPVEVMGTYTVAGELVNLKISKPGGLTPMAWKVSIAGSEMTVVFEQGGALKLDASSLKYRRTS